MGCRTGPSSQGDPRAGDGIGKPGDPMYALQAGRQHGVMIAPFHVPEVCSSLLAQANTTGGSRPSGSTVDTAESLVAFAMRGRDGENVPEPGPPGLAISIRGASGGSTHQFVAYSLMPMRSATDFKARETEIAQPLTAGGPHPTGNQGGDCIVVFSSKDHGQDASFDVAPTLRAMGFAESHANGGGQLAVAFQERGRSGARSLESQDQLAYSINAPSGGGRRQENNIAVAFDTTQITHPENRSNPRPGDPCHTLPHAGHAPSVAISFPTQMSGTQTHHAHEGTAQTIQARNPTGIAFEAPVLGADPQSGRFRVRRLTPRECERLQAAPDDFTLVPYTNGRPMADGKRYEMIGNSQSANVIRWIGHGIAAVEALIRAENWKP